MSMQMQSLLANPVGSFANGSRMTSMVSPLGFYPRMSNRVNFAVKCMAEEGAGQGEPKLDSGLPKTTPPMAASPTPTPTPKPQPKVTLFLFLARFMLSCTIWIWWWNLTFINKIYKHL